MKFEEKYPFCPAGKSAIETIGLTIQEMRDLPDNYERFYAGMYYKVDEIGLCWICQAETPWIDISFEAFCCSTECSEKSWQMYEDACRESDRKYGNNMVDENNPF